MSIKDWLSAAIMGAICGAIFVGMLHLLSRPIGDGEVVGASITAAVAAGFAFAQRGRAAS